MASEQTVRLLDVEYLVSDASFGSGGQTAYYVRGHIDLGEFISYLESEYGRDARTEFVRHTYMGFSPPDRDGTRTAWFSKTARRGAFPVTYFDLDAQERASYYDRHPEHRPLVSPPQSEEAKDVSNG